jgi:hypothetical protein
MSTPTAPNLQDAAAPKTPPKKTTPTGVTQPGHDIVVTSAFSLIGVALLALLANAGPKVGKIVIILMVGFAIGWAMLNSGWMQKVLGKPTGIDPIYKRFTG